MDTGRHHGHLRRGAAAEGARGPSRPVRTTSDRPRRGRATPDCPRRRGFTLVELLVVIAVIVILVGILFPTFNSAREQALASNCQMNLKRLADVLHVRTAESSGSLPACEAWISFVIKQQAPSLLICPSDTLTSVQTRADSSDLAQLYLLHKHGSSMYFHRLADLLAGNLGNDSQMHVLVAGNYGTPPPEEGNWNWLLNQPVVGGTIRDNQVAISIDNDAAVLITYGEVITIHSLTGQVASMASNHYLCKGDWQSGWENQVVMRLWGDDYHQIDPRSPYTLSSGLSSYGMNNQVRQTTPRLDQLMLIDARRSVLDFAGLGSYIDDEDVILPRHMGKANLTTVEGSVRAITLDELNLELGKPDGGIWKSR
jgi:prepilin-type N-terminal cleavage/methylation domain-containing protein